METWQKWKYCDSFSPQTLNSHLPHIKVFIWWGLQTRLTIQWKRCFDSLRSYCCQNLTLDKTMNWVSCQLEKENVTWSFAFLDAWKVGSEFLSFGFTFSEMPPYMILLFIPALVCGRLGSVAWVATCQTKGQL